MQEKLEGVAGRGREAFFGNQLMNIVKIDLSGCLGGSVVERLPSAQGVILDSQDRVPHRAPCMKPASPSACVSASLSQINKILKYIYTIHWMPGWFSQKSTGLLILRL